MHSGGISIWFFIGISLLVNGILIVQAGVRERFKISLEPEPLIA